MALIGFLALLMLYVIASIQQSSTDGMLRSVEIGVEKWIDEKRQFREAYGADDSVVGNALYEESYDTQIAKDMRQRLLTEADVDCKSDNSFYRYNPHLIALGIMAQSGKIPNDFIDRGIAWSVGCMEKLPGGFYPSDKAAMEAEKFIRWYDNELTKNGVPEHLIQRRSEVSMYTSLIGKDYVDKTIDIRKTEKLGYYDVLFWPSTRDCYTHGASLRQISRRLVT